MLLLAATWLHVIFKLQGVVAYALAVLPALPVVGMAVAVGLYFREETDEFERAVRVESALWATGVTLAAAMRLDPAVAAEAVRPAGRVIAFSQLLRRAATSPRPGWTPQAWDAAADTDVAAHLGHKLDLLVDEARSAAPVSPGAFPAVAFPVHGAFRGS